MWFSWKWPKVSLFFVVHRTFCNSDIDRYVRVYRKKILMQFPTFLISFSYARILLHPIFITRRKKEERKTTSKLRILRAIVYKLMHRLKSFLTCGYIILSCITISKFNLIRLLEPERFNSQWPSMGKNAPQKCLLAKPPDLIEICSWNLHPNGYLSELFIWGYAGRIRSGGQINFLILRYSLVKIFHKICS